MNLAKILIIGVTFGLLATSGNAAELITNGNFETGNFHPDNVVVNGQLVTRYDTIRYNGPQDLTGWTVAPLTSLVWGLSPTDINVHAGNGFVDLTGVGNTVPHGILTQSYQRWRGSNTRFQFLQRSISAAAMSV